MRSRIMLAAVAVLGALSSGAVATSGRGMAPARQWAIANFTDPVLVTDQLLMGTFLIVHDDAKMERGEACTSFYRFDAARGPQEEVVAFHCTPVNRAAAGTFKVTRSDLVPSIGVRRLTEYQFAGDCEGHAIPTKP
jgi:hypothetical protein